MENERTRCINCMWKIAREGGRVSRRGDKVSSSYGGSI